MFVLPISHVRLAMFRIVGTFLRQPVFLLVSSRCQPYLFYAVFLIRLTMCLIGGLHGASAVLTLSLVRSMWPVWFICFDRSISLSPSPTCAPNVGKSMWARLRKRPLGAANTCSPSNVSKSKCFWTLINLRLRRGCIRPATQRHRSTEIFF